MSGPDQDRRFLESPCSRVRATEPVPPDPYWRLEWDERGVRRQTSGGRTEATATAKVLKIAERLDTDGAPKSRARLDEALSEYTEYSEGHHSKNHHSKTIPDLTKAFDSVGRIRCEDLSRKHVKAAHDASATQSSADHRRSRISAFLKWGYREEYFTKAQTNLTDSLHWTAPPGTIVPPGRQFTPPQTGDHDRYVTPDQVPSHAAIADLGDAAQKLVPFGKLMIETTYNVGYRSGELYAAQAPAVALEDCEVAINWQALSLPGLPSRLSRPKHGRVRTSNFAEVTLTGYPLKDQMGERLEQVEWEYAKGRNPNRLLFPTTTGKYHWASGFGSNVFSPAAEAAGWESVTWTDKNNRTHRLWVHTMHSLRHRFARDRIDSYDHTIAELQAVGGWKSAEVVWQRYYSPSSDLLSTSGQKLRAA